MALDLTVVITTYNSAAVIGASLASLLALPPEEAPAGITVVDNASFDGSAAIAESFSGVTVIRSPRNAGLARANNLGAAKAGPGSILFLNPDTVTLPGAFAALAAFEVGHPDAAILGPATIDSLGDIQSTARTFPSLLDIALRRSLLGRIPVFRSRVARHLHPVDGTAPARVDWLVGAALWLTRRGRDRVGLMSEDYFLYFEDVDLVLARRGVGDGSVAGPGSSHPSRMCEGKCQPSGRALWHHLRSMVRFFSRHPSALF